MKKSFVIALVVLILVATSLLKNGYGITTKNQTKEILIPNTDQQQKKGASAEKAEKVSYTCPMHPEVISDKPGKCPKCGMDLVKKETAKVIYTCPMHPEVTDDKPGKCPKCGMNLVIKESVKKQKSTEPMKGM